MSQFESAVDLICEDRRLQPLEAALLRACVKGETLDDLQPVFWKYGGKGDNWNLSSELYHLGDWGYVSPSFPRYPKSGKYKPSLGYLSKIEGDPDIYIITDKGREALQKFDQHRAMIQSMTDAPVSVLQAVVLRTAWKGATRGELLQAYAKAGGKNSDIAFSSMFPKISDWWANKSTEYWRKPVKAMGWLTRIGEPGSYV